MIVWLHYKFGIPLVKNVSNLSVVLSIEVLIAVFWSMILQIRRPSKTQKVGKKNLSNKVALKILTLSHLLQLEIKAIKHQKEKLKLSLLNNGANLMETLSTSKHLPRMTLTLMLLLWLLLRLLPLNSKKMQSSSHLSLLFCKLIRPKRKKNRTTALVDQENQSV